MRSSAEIIKEIKEKDLKFLSPEFQELDRELYQALTYERNKGKIETQEVVKEEKPKPKPRKRTTKPKE